MLSKRKNAVIKKRAPAHSAERSSLASVAGNVDASSVGEHGVGTRERVGNPVPSLGLLDTSYQKTPVVLWFGCDFLRLTLGGEQKSGIIESLFSGLSANSSEKYDMNFLGFPHFSFQIKELGDSRIGDLRYGETQVIQFTIMLKAGSLTNCKYRVEFASSVFHMPEMRPMLIKALKLWGTLERTRVTRCDLALDLDCTVADVWRGRKTAFRKEQVIGTKNDMETFYLGSKTKNKKHFIRVYNKKLDSTKKGKFHLFGHYLLMEHPVTRIEVQMNVQSCDALAVHVSDILSLLELDTNQTLQCVAWRNFLNLTANRDSTCLVPVSRLDNLGAHVERKRRTKRTLDLSEALPYAKVMLGYAKNLEALGFDPVGWLRKELDMLKFLRDTPLQRIAKSVSDNVSSVISDSQKLI